MKYKSLWWAVMIGLIFFGLMLMVPSMAFAQSNSFSDVDKSSSHYDAIMALAEKGFVDGYQNGTFGINNKLERRHGAVLFYQVLELSEPVDIKERLSRYDDVKVNDEYAKQIAAVTPDIFEGSNRSFNPVANMTREQMATTIVQAFDLKDNGNKPGVNLGNVGDSHKEKVKILAQHGLTNQLDDFRPKQAVKRGQFVTFLHQAMTETDKPDLPQPDKPAENDYVTVSYDISFFEAMNRQNSPKVDGGGHFIASRELLEYYANPNNFTEDTPEFFQFLKLSYEPGLTTGELNKKILKGKGSLEGTGKAFIKAAKKHDINVIYLIAHAMHETANGTSDLATGIKVNGKKTYNMFGIGAYDSCPASCGAQKAFDEGWFTPAAAVEGGASFIDNGYIGNGQDTLYKMRWNPDSPGFPQYATHVQWATIQARDIASMYELAGLLDTYTFRFDIPKYQNQPGASPRPTGDDQYAVDVSDAGTKYRVQTSGESGLRIRTYPWGEIIRVLPKNSLVEVVGENGGWFKVEAGSTTGWVSGDYLVSPSQLKIVLPSNISRIQVRLESNEESRHIGSVHDGDTLSGVVNKKGDYIKKNGYYKIRLNGEQGWVYEDYVKEL